MTLTGGLAAELLESWDLETEWVDAIEFVTRRVLEDQQQDIMMEFRQNWPTYEVNSAEPSVVVDEADRQVRMAFVVTGGVVLQLEPIPFDEFE